MIGLVHVKSETAEGLVTISDSQRILQQEV